MRKIYYILVYLVLSISSYAQIDLLTKAAEAGDVDAQKYLGYSYFEGKNGVKKNLQESRKWYLAAANQGDAESQYRIAMFQYDINGERWNSEDEFVETVNWMQKSADNGYAEAQVHLALAFMMPYGNPKAFKYYKMAADQDYVQAYDGMGECYRLGLGTEENVDKAMEYYQLAIDNNILWSYIGLAYCYHERSDYQNTIKCYNKAIEAGFAQGYNDLAYMYAKGEGVKKDLKEAHRLVDLALEKEPNKIEFLDSKGEFYLMENKLKEATDIWTRMQNVNERYTIEEETTFCTVMRSTIQGSVDIDIAETNIRNENTYVVIIANEKYRREMEVPFANNDGFIFSEYCKKTLGIPEKNVQFITDATYNDIRYAVNWLKQVLEASEGKAKVIFYYAGHGIPNESEKTAFLLPIDGYGSDVSTGYSLDDLYSTLGALPSQSAMVFLDACFSGSKRDGEMLASARGVAIKVKKSVPAGKMVVFSAAQGDETAYPYEEQKHGMFTYYLLKKLQETKGDVSLGELSNYVIKEVKQQSIVQNKKMQTPTIVPSAQSNGWENWKLR